MNDHHAFFLDKADHGIVMLTDAVVASISEEQLLSAVENHPWITKALWQITLVDLSIARAWQINLGQRTALVNVASLFREIWHRARLIGINHEGEFTLPLTQDQLGDAVGLTSIHVNRMLRNLRDLNLVEFRSKRVTIPNIKGLMEIADFDPTYLHLQQRKSRWDICKVGPKPFNFQSQFIAHIRKKSRL